MSIGNALSNALSGLNAVSRAADVVSSNVSNAMTEGYGRREIELTSQTLGRFGAGVEVTSITRQSDPVITGERRIADGEVALAETRTDFLNDFTRAMGQPDEAGSISGQIVSLEASLIEASSRPESEARLQNVLYAAQSLTEKINSTADSLVESRIAADQDIGKAVDVLQSSLQQVADLNVAIQQGQSSGYDINSLLDKRQSVVDQISQIVPVKEVLRENNMVALYTPGGSILVDSKAAELGFSTVATIAPEMSVASGALSGLTINGQPVSTDANKGPIAGGRLAGLFEVRDELIPDAQIKLDAVARDLIERFQTSDVDPTLAIGDAGFFTDGGEAFDPLNEVALSGRLSVNSGVDPVQSGDLWKIRDGLGASAEGEQGNASLLLAMTDALQSSRVVSSGGFSSAERTASGLSADFYSIIESDALNFETGMSFSAARQENLKSIELEAGVDTDFEMQQLLIIERNYAANAKVIQTVDTLLNQLIGMV
ncbi:flagellar hook-associated protein 1 FlgK [Pacificibacter maritimus]|uniref:Flagellar hook-associated protein 1 n=1 Tax=Pacificibacter maritimus TaxID=762213 RepID=A0A3N4U8S3_9RHOB|nr:flagellar hook-associated protein FlgK [Pacificibacter maritimus]RPE64755.1 flagellar hook-associated protein 1 FlgK [Pacificibacter maritimus]